MSLIFLDEKNLFLQTKFAAETDATTKPEFGF
jgi:hypothetical protein